MPKAANKTVPTDTDVAAFLAREQDPARRAACDTLVALMARITGVPPVMWGSSIVGFGRYHYRYDSGREGDWCQIGFSPRKAAITIYALGGTDPALVARLGKVKAEGSCLYVKRLDDIELGILERILWGTIATLAAQYGADALDPPPTAVA